MKVSPPELQARVTDRLRSAGVPEAEEIGWACIWLEACGYPGLKMLSEAFGDERKDIVLTRDSLGLDLANVSCAFLAPRISREVAANGRVYLRNVRHGLYLLPFAVRANIGIGCPVDPSFAIGGERSKNPYGEKLAAAEANGLTVDESLLDLLEH